mmetsp:Transcript_43085/g.122120  ORF Transcript_43085/g.122120 Transcript_43085/m.122120 type:complete len:259 (+) Transcript_43085:977-1753(+)
MLSLSPSLPPDRPSYTPSIHPSLHPFIHTQLSLSPNCCQPVSRAIVQATMIVHRPCRLRETTNTDKRSGAHSLTYLLSSSTLCRISLMTASGSSALKIAVPATIAFAPAAAAIFVVSTVSPPSTSMVSEGYLARAVLTLSIMSSMNFCPPKPGSTVMTSNVSIRPESMTGSTSSMDVLGFNTMPACMPFALMSLAISSASAVLPAASMWKVNWLTPACANSSTHLWGSDTIRWQSKKPLLCGRRAATTGAPNVKFGTK